MYAINAQVLVHKRKAYKIIFQLLFYFTFISLNICNYIVREKIHVQFYFNWANNQDQAESLSTVIKNIFI